MDKIEYTILNFVGFLNATSEVFQKLDTVVENSDYLKDLQNDYFQANWEILVESVICVPGKEFLQIYGEGADCNKNSSRVCFSQKKPTHRIKLSPKRSGKVLDRMVGEKIEIEEYLFDSFVSYSGKDYELKSPYNGVLLEHETENSYAVVDIDDIIFKKVKVSH